VISPDPVPEEGIFVRSDQYALVRQGVPSLLISLGLKSSNPGVDALAMAKEWSETKHHSPQDDAPQAIHYESSARLANLAAALGHAVAMAPEPPRWNANDFVGRALGSSNQD